jgi:hypothetical protein
MFLLINNNYEESDCIVVVLFSSFFGEYRDTWFGYMAGVLNSVSVNNADKCVL